MEFSGRLQSHSADFNSMCRGNSECPQPLGLRHVQPAVRAVRLPEGDLPVAVGDGTSKSAASRRFVALSAERLAEWMRSDLSKLDLLVIQIDGLHIGNDLVLVAALGIDSEGHKHPLGVDSQSGQIGRAHV